MHERCPWPRQRRVRAGRGARRRRSAQGADRARQRHRRAPPDAIAQCKPACYGGCGSYTLPASTARKTMGLSTHVLDTAHGCPAAGMQVILQRTNAQGEAQTVKQLTLNADGRADQPLLTTESMAPGRYRLLFAVAP